MADNVYVHWAKMKQWSLHDAISLLADYEVMQLGIAESRHFYTLRESIYKRHAGSFRRFFKNNVNLLTKVSYLENAYDSEEYCENDKPSIDFKTSFANSSDIIKWAVSSGVKVPKEFVVVTSDQTTDDETLAEAISSKSACDQNSENDDSPLISDERRKYNLLKLQKETMDMAIMAAVKLGLYYASLKEGDIFDKDILYEKIREWKLGAVTKDSIELIYQSLPPKHKRKPGEKKTIKNRE